MKILIFTEKYGKQMFPADTQEQVDEALYTIYKERLASGSWYQDVLPMDLPTNLIQLRKFMFNRRDHQYESYATRELDPTESVPKEFYA